MNYSVENTGNATAVSSWIDSVFLSPTAAISSSSVLVGRVTHTGAVDDNGTYSGSLTPPVPPVLPGHDYVVVEVDSQGLVPDSERAATVLATTSTFVVNVPSVPLGPRRGSYTGHRHHLRW